MRTILSRCAVVAVLCFSASAVAKATPEEAARLKRDLTPLGAEKAGNAAGTIPAWDGGWTQAPPGYGGRGKHSRLLNPFPGDKPQFTITADNYDQYREQLSAGQLAMFRKYPKTFKMPVYQTRRTAAGPQWFYDATFQNATRAELDKTGEALMNAVSGLPFPIPKSGKEPIWNHKTRYRGLGGRRWNNQFAVTTAGDFNAVVLREDVLFAYNRPNIKPSDLDNVLIYFLQVVTAPPRLAGTITLVHETMDQVKEPRRAWQYNPGQRRLRRAPNVGYDNPGTASDGLRTNDQLDAFNGAMDRYTWKIMGKKEMYVPYNGYLVHDAKYKYRDIIKPGHANQDLMRYELHRVWVVDSETRPGTTHIYKRRTFYLEEDYWTIVLVDCYDRRNQLWRFQELHPIEAYDAKDPLMGASMEAIYDLLNNRYLVLGLNNEHEETYQHIYDINYFNPANVSKQATK